MSVDGFFDTNVLIYAVSSAADEVEKRDRAIELIERVDFGLSAQVLQEFYVAVTRKIADPLAPDAAIEFVEQFRVFPLVRTDYPLIVSGVEISVRYGISYWDAAIIAAAEALGAGTLFSEDLSHGQMYGSVEVVNPFLLEAADGVHEVGTKAYADAK